MAARRSSGVRKRKPSGGKANSKAAPRRSRAKDRAAGEGQPAEILVHLAPEEARMVLRSFAERHPEIVPELEGIYRDAIASVAFESVADQVVEALEELTILDLSGRDSADPFRHKGDTELAYEAFEERIAPFVEVLARYVRMGLVEPALRQCQGVLLGLYRAESERVTELMDWLPDGLSSFAEPELIALEPVQSRLMEGGEFDVATALRRFAAEHLPDWDWLRAEG